MKYTSLRKQFEFGDGLLTIDLIDEDVLFRGRNILCCLGLRFSMTLLFVTLVLPP